MDVSVDILLFVAVIGLLQAFLLASIIYFHPKSEHSVSKYLALYIFFLCVPMFTPVVNRFVTWQYLLLMDPFPLLVGPCLLLYVKSHKETITFRKAFPHFILFILYVFFDIGLFIYFKQNYPPGPDVPVDAIHHPSAIVRIPGRFIQMIAYFFIASKALTNYQRSINHMFSETSEINLGWVRWLINGFLFLTLVMLTMYFFIVTYPQNFRVFLLINTAIVTPYIYLVTFKGITQLTLWQKSGLNKEKVQEAIHDVEEVTEVAEGPNERDQKNALSRERREVIVMRTLELMEADKLYLEAELTLQHLADRMKIPSYQVSQAINEGMNKNFYDLVNGYRVEEAKRKLLDPKNSNIKVLAVGMEAGFNSKTTFNTVFKKFTGLTPTDFRSSS